VLDGRARTAERLTLALRTRPGIKLGVAEADLSEMAACLDELAGDGLVETDGASAHLTRRGRLLATAVTARVLDVLDGHPVAPAGTR
jgi:coproporphyrinogen III oxidase-like Fe-S oxidoreductase